MRSPNFNRLVLIIQALFISTASMAIASDSRANSQKNEPVTIHFVDRPPYSISTAGGEPAGVVATPVANVFRQAGIPFVWEMTPVNRQFAIIKGNQGKNCAIGFEKTADRETFGKFTEPVYIGQPIVAIASLQVHEKSGVTLKHMLSKYTILVKENYTQGSIVTGLIKKAPNKYLISVGSEQMVQMIAMSRADFMLISNDEVEYYVHHGVLDPHSFRVLHLSDVNFRFHRRIMCNKAMDDQVIKKLNRAITELHVKPVPFKNVIKP